MRTKLSNSKGGILTRPQPSRVHTLPRLFGLALSCVLSCVLGLGCTVRSLRRAETPRPVQPVPASLAKRYLNHSQAIPTVKLEARGLDPQIRHLHGSFDNHPTALEQARKVSFDYFQSLKRGQTRHAPVILFTPILGGRMGLERGVARGLAKEGFHVILVHKERKMFRRSWSAQDIERKFRAAIAERKRVIDWLVTRPEVDRQRIGAFGISMGGIVTAVLTPLDERIRAAVMVMPGGNIDEILMRTEEGPLRKYCERRMDQEGLSPAMFQKRIRDTLSSDPIHLAPYVDPRRVMVIVARYDDVVPTDIQLKLWRALGRPKGYEIPTGHYSAFALMPFLHRKTVEFFQRRFKNNSASSSKNTDNSS